MIIHKPHLCSKLSIWSPKYNSGHGDWEVWIAVRKIAYASPVVIIEFTKAKHLIGGRFCIKRQDVEQCEQGTNGRIPVYKVPFSKLESWESAKEVYDIAVGLWDD